MPADYLPVLIYICVAFGIALALLGLGLLLGRGQRDERKLEPYECGFDAFEDSRMRFDVRYYLVAILFIIFDLEIAFLFPWALALGDIGLYGFGSMMVFLALLTAGFVYEWRKGALEWE